MAQGMDSFLVMLNIYMYMFVSFPGPQNSHTLDSSETFCAVNPGILCRISGLWYLTIHPIV
jgi:hypothetical protein